MFPTQSVSTPKRPEGELTRRRRCSRTKEDRQRRTKRKNTRAIEGVKPARRAQKKHSRSLRRTKGEVRRRDRVNIKTATPERAGRWHVPVKGESSLKGRPRGVPGGPGRAPPSRGIQGAQPRGAEGRGNDQDSPESGYKSSN